ncbi:MAG: oligopeptide ABC transporter permease OppB [Gammaproteobacteria bacterium]|nr:oligopeptide ABC transporter permease OppB [Gammaproteobacteria bacterium]MYJ52874.1 oligopeptide ABC transporter permease OppB [Gammaproteobacteria bacterium]
MLYFILKRTAIAIPTILALIVLSFALMHFAPGSPFTGERPLPPEILANLEAKYGLDRPFPEQVARYVWNIVTDFDFGPSYSYKDRTVNEIIAQGFPVTLTYGSLAFVVSILVGVGLGIAAAIHRSTWLDSLAVGVTVGAQVLPNFVMAPILVLIFTLWLGWLPGGGWQGGQWPYLVMPIIALSTSFMASIARITRSSMIETLNSDFVLTARSKGLPFREVVIRHALKPSMLPVISYLGPTFVGLITGSVVIDIYFSTGGIGQHFVNAAINRDYPLIMGVTILTGILTVVFNLIVDVLYVWIDPRIRY